MSKLEKHRKRKGLKPVEEMDHAEMREEMTKIITRDVMRFLEVVVEQRVKLFVHAIYEGIRK